MKLIFTENSLDHIYLCLFRLFQVSLLHTVHHSSKPPSLKSIGKLVKLKQEDNLLSREVIHSLPVSLVAHDSRSFPGGHKGWQSRCSLPPLWCWLPRALAPQPLGPSSPPASSWSTRNQLVGLDNHSEKDNMQIESAVATCTAHLLG